MPVWIVLVLSVVLPVLLLVIFFPPALIWIWGDIPYWERFKRFWKEGL